MARIIDDAAVSARDPDTDNDRHRGHDQKPGIVLNKRQHALGPPGHCFFELHLDFPSRISSEFHARETH
jgi:hypothetical protein